MSRDVLNVSCECIICGREDLVSIPAPVNLENIYEIAWKKFNMREWHRLPKADERGQREYNKWIYYCPECGGR